MKKILFFLFTFIFASNLISQWSSNLAINSTVCDLDQKQTFSKIAATSDGGCYVTWFDSRGNGHFKVYLQRYDINGFKQFATDGLLISDKPQNSWFGDYDLKVDAGNNAIIVFSDKRQAVPGDTTVNPYAYKISPSGQFLWGPDGVTLSPQPSTYQMWPKAAVLSDQSVAFVWWYFYPQTRTTWLKIQRVSSTGVVQYTNPIDIQSPDGKRYQYPNIVHSDNGNFIVSWVYGPKDTVGSFVPDNVSVFCNKYNSAGSTVWGTTPKTVYTETGNHIPIYMIPTVISDGNNGIVIGFYYTTSTTILSSVQRFTSAGTQIYGNNGILLSTSDLRMHIEPKLCVNSSTNDIFAFYTDVFPPTSQDFEVITGQRLSSSGSRLWGDNGISFSQADTVSIFGIGCNVKDTNVVVTFNTQFYGPVYTLYKGFSVGPSGLLQWGGTMKNLSDVMSNKFYTNSTMTTGGMTICSWEDTRNSPTGESGGIYCQNLKQDGTLGPVGIKTLSSEIPEKFYLHQNYPNPFNPVTNIKFELRNSSFVNLNIYDAIGRHVKSLVSQNLQEGTYQVDFNAGEFSSGVYFYELKAGDFVQRKSMIMVK